MALLNLHRGMSVEERNGEYVAVTDIAIVELPTPTSFVAAMSDDGVPQPGEAAGDIDLKNCRVVNRRCKVIGSREGFIKFEIAIDYEIQRESQTASDNEAQNSNKTQYAVEGGAVLTRGTTQKDRDGTTIKLKYENASGDSTVQVAEADVFFINRSLTREITEATDDPDSIVDEWANKVNSTTFRGGAARQWLCTSVRYRLVNANKSPKEYKFRFEFERKPNDETWKYTVAWKEDGKIPGDVVDGSSPFGLKTIDWHSEKDFTEKFS